jgi:hypothetical protein
MKKLDRRMLNTINHYQNVDKKFAGKIEKLIIGKSSGYVQGKFSSGWVTETVLSLVVDGKAYQCFSGSTERIKLIAQHFNAPLECNI